jgi:prepilin-type N-terminal cleavage/methylation domain-containing protein/prepilin-type processing-associated H-X9-DG protein
VGESGCHGGFTLVELLVVIVILLFLAALVAAATLRAAAKGRQTTCASNLRQIALAARLYAADYDGIPPPWSTGCQPGTPDSPRLAWTLEALRAYGATGTVWFCPSDPNRGKYGVITDLVPHWLTSYWYPGWNYLPQMGLPPPDILDLNSTAVERCYFIAADARRFDTDGAPPFGRGSWHAGGFNVAYIDGHVRWVPLLPDLDHYIPNPFWTAEPKEK